MGYSASQAVVVELVVDVEVVDVVEVVVAKAASPAQ